MSESTELYEKMNDEIRAKKPKIAICYDFDKTLSPDDMQTFTLIPSFGIDKSEFWQSSNKLAKDNLMDTNLAWMHELIRYSEFKRKSLKREYFRKIGADVELYKGVKTWFKRMNEYAEKKGIELEHYIISSGLKEIIEGSEIAQYFKRIYASTYLYSADGVAKWPAQAINYTNKTQFIFRIAKGFLEEYDERVNDSMPDELLRIPYENIVYIGDSATDIPCMRLVKSKGGYSIGVFDPQKDNRGKVYQLFSDGRINFYAPADYSANSEISKYGVIYYTRNYYPSLPTDLEVQIVSALANYDLSKENTVANVLARLKRDHIIDEETRKKWSTQNGFQEFAKIVQENYMVTPTYTNERLRKQSGVFLLASLFSVSGVADIAKSVISKSRGDLRNAFEKEFFFIRGENKEEILKELDLYNINEATLFPELEHQLSYIKYINSGNVLAVADFEKYDTHSTRQQFFVTATWGFRICPSTTTNTPGRNILKYVQLQRRLHPL